MYRTPHTGYMCKALLATLIIGVVATTAPAQPNEDDEPAKPRDVTLRTKDGVRLECTYFPPPEDDDDVEGKKVVPIILLHGWGQRRSQVAALASFLQKLKHAVIVPDLRGHGGSTRVVFGDDEKTIDPDKLNRRQIAQISGTGGDLEAVKKFLLDENNKGNVNIELLTIIGIQESCPLALTYAMVDWQAPSLRTLKQGQDVKVLILLSPVQSFKGVTAQNALKTLGLPAVRSKVAIQFITGTQADHFQDAQKMHRTMERFHKSTSGENLSFRTVDTNLEGTRILRSTYGTATAETMARFIDERLVRRGDRFPWTDRTSPFSQ